MTTNFPTGLDNLDATRGQPGNPLSSPNHITHHANEDDAIEAIETKLGVDGSADINSIDYKLKNASSSNPGHKHTLANGATDVTATATELNYVDGVTAPIQTQLNDLDAEKIGESIVDAKGDLIVGTAADTVARLAVGSDTQVLTADSSAPNGVKWATGAPVTDIQTFNSNGTWTKPSGGLKVLVQMWGGGASGAKTQNGGGGSGGGGGGMYLEGWFNAADLAGTVAITIGTGGTAISANDTNGNDGVATTFGSLLSARGGYGGIRGAGGGNDGTGGAGGRPHAGGTAISGIFPDGAVSSVGGAGLYSGAGGGATLASTAYAGGASTFGGAGGGGASSTNQGAGGTSTYGGNGSAGVSTGSASAGSVPGGGGGAAVSAGNSGAGGAGRVIVTTFF